MQKWIGRSSIYNSDQVYYWVSSTGRTDFCCYMIDNDCMCRGKTKKVKKYREEGEAYRGGRNPFQVLLNLSKFFLHR